MVGEKVIPNKLGKSIKLFFYEDTVNNIDKYGKEVTRINSSTGQYHSETSLKTTIYYGKDKFLQVDSDVPINYGWTVKTLYLQIEDYQKELLCYKIVESDQYFVSDDVEQIIARKYDLKSHGTAKRVLIAFLFLISAISLDSYLFKTGHLKWGIIASIISFIASLFLFTVLYCIGLGDTGYKCTKKYNEIISYIYKAMHQLRDRGKELTK